MLEARVTAVADVYDALRSARSYREAWTREQAREHIRKGAGSHVDPDCVEAFLKVGDGWEAAFAADGDACSELRPAV